MPRIRLAEAAGVGAYEGDRASCQSMEALVVLGTEICTPGQDLTKEWLLPLAFRKRLIVGEVAPESGSSSVSPTTEASETTTARGVRKAACCPISTAKKQQILSLEPTGMSAREIAVEVGVTESTVSVTCRQVKQPPRRKRRFTADDLRRAQQFHAQGAPLHRDRPGARIRVGCIKKHPTGAGVISKSSTTTVMM